TYLYTAVTDLGAELHDAGLLDTSERLFTSLTDRRMYLTGGLGPSAANEGMTADFDLPNERAYAETCASIGLVFWAERLLEARPDRRWGDELERALYNNVLAGVSLDGRRFFYDNKLESHGGHERFEWHSCPCCPPNLARLLASLGAYVYGANDRELAVHLYASGSASLTLDGQAVRLEQETAYPWEGTVNLQVGASGPARFALLLRLPGWCREPNVKLNGSPVALDGSNVRNGYAVLEREWRDGDRVTLELPMPLERVYAHPNVAQDAGLVALQRGPLVYCLESVDNPALDDLAIEPEGGSVEFDPDLLGGVGVLNVPARRDEAGAWGGALYRFSPPPAAPATVRAVPYSVWANRGDSQMRVWLRRAAVPAGGKEG
ncbi:MAG TPA: beta-L-arabinofuranosidase domain-containing protein, partial [Deinococcales bacterium]|nr:beta-L-arabinofuranosidase domain-containing protein [Deinococcales bacterium]